MKRPRMLSQARAPARSECISIGAWLACFLRHVEETQILLKQIRSAFPEMAIGWVIVTVKKTVACERDAPAAACFKCRELDSATRRAEHGVEKADGEIPTVGPPNESEIVDETIVSNSNLVEACIRMII